MKIYIAGPMTDIKHYNYPEFHRAAVYWRDHGHEVLTPFDANSAIWNKHHKKPFEPGVDKCDYGDPLLLEMFAEDLAYVCWCDALALLPGWENSKGGRVEITVANLLGKKFMDAHTGMLLELMVAITIQPITRTRDL